MKSIRTFAIFAIISFTGCKESKIVKSDMTTQQKKSLVQLAIDNSKDRVTRDAQGNVIEVDLRGLQLSDQFVESLLEPELRTLQKFAVSGSFITDQTISRLMDSRPYPIYREIVFEDTSVASPDNHPWVKQYREQHQQTKLVFTTKRVERDANDTAC